MRRSSVKVLTLKQASWKAAAVTERKPSRRSDSTDIGPRLERMQPCGAKLACGEVVAVKVERVDDLVESGEKGCAWRADVARSQQPDLIGNSWPSFGAHCHADS
jgi:uncharacterized protein (DUF2147 family)